ncbi:ribosome modulation factor [Pseudomonas taeanensis MS-3]|jgi:ribosome modulation factor|uniref:Ribosome modulation factor n=1 Tax=Pseudomonas taeanensis MS-3 TaxID=1395571 RepID=A0A0A1YQN9_9PSED|nr:ribosome modulation factor [Pseudomonas taeanensis]KFX71219.1 ribosome modulation factor [Pseudomonas taeanensis MS-3]
MAPDALPDDDGHWSLESLNKAYQQGYMAGLTGQPSAPPHAEVLAAAWEAGWSDGHEQMRRQQKIA